MNLLINKNTPYNIYGRFVGNQHQRKMEINSIWGCSKKTIGLFIGGIMLIKNTFFQLFLLLCHVLK